MYRDIISKVWYLELFAVKYTGFNCENCMLHARFETALGNYALECTKYANLTHIGI